jgi:hypothetical protein
MIVSTSTAGVAKFLEEPVPVPNEVDDLVFQGKLKGQHMYPYNPYMVQLHSVTEQNVYITKLVCTKQIPENDSVFSVTVINLLVHKTAVMLQDV